MKRRSSTGRGGAGRTSAIWPQPLVGDVVAVRRRPNDGYAIILRGPASPDPIAPAPAPPRPRAGDSRAPPARARAAARAADCRRRAHPPGWQGWQGNRFHRHDTSAARAPGRRRRRRATPGALAHGEQRVGEWLTVLAIRRDPRAAMPPCRPRPRARTPRERSTPARLSLICAGIPISSMSIPRRCACCARRPARSATGSSISSISFTSASAGRSSIRVNLEYRNLIGVSRGNLASQSCAGASRRR